MNFAKGSSLLHAFRHLGVGFLCLVVGGAFFPQHAMGQTCYSVQSGRWDDPQTWAGSSTGSSGSCTSASSDYPSQSGEDAIIQGDLIRIDVTKSTALVVGSVTLEEGSLLRPTASAGTRSFEPTSYESFDSDGDGRGKFELNNFDGNLNVKVTGDFLNRGDIVINDQTFQATSAGTQSRNRGTITVRMGGILDVDHTFNNDGSGTLDYNDGTIEFASGFQNDGAVSTTTSSEVKFDGGGNTQTVSGSNLTGSNGGFSNLTITNNSIVDPDPGNGTILVTGALTVGSGGRYGEDPDITTQETADLRYEGESFSVSGTLFADAVRFAANNNGTSYTTVDGAVFALVEIRDGTAVEVGSSSFTVNGPVFVNNNNVLNVSNNGTTLQLSGDFQNNGTIEAIGSGTIKFNGEGSETNCTLVGSDLECQRRTGDDSDKNFVQEYAGSSATYNALRIQDDDGDSTAETDVKFSDSANPVVVQSNLIIDEASLETIRPIELNNGDLDVRTNGSIDFKGDRLLTLSGSSPASLTTQSPLEIATINMEKSGGTMTFNDAVTVTDRLRMLGGTLLPKSTLTIQNVLQLGDPNDDNTSPVVDVINGGGTLELVSDDNNDAYIEYVDSNNDDTNDGSVNGEVTYQRYLNGSVDWYYLATPADAGTNTSFDEFLQQGSGTNDLRTRGVTGADDKQDNSLFASVRLYDETEPGVIDPSGDEVDAGWKAIDCEGGYSGCVSGLGASMESGRGYAVYGYKNDVGRTSQSGFPKTIDSNVEPITNTSFDFTPLLDATGQGDGIDKNDGWNLLGNPYMTTLDFCKMSRSNLQGGNNDDTKPDVQVWDPQNGAYANYNCDSSTANGAGNGLLNGYIAPHQSFFVKATTTNPSLTIGDITNVQANASDFFQKEETQDDSAPPAVRLQLSLDDYKYTTSAAFLEDRTNGMDDSDSYYFGGARAKSGMSFYSVLDDGTPIVSNALPRNFSEETTVSLAIDGCDYGTTLKGEATIAASTLRNIPASWGLTLEDTKTGKTADLSDASQYTFDYTGNCPTSKSSATTEGTQPPSPRVITHPSAKDGGSPDTRFKLHVDPNAVPPVELSRFTAEAKNRAAVLSWATARQRNVEGFAVQRETEEGSFETLDDTFVQGVGDGTTTESRSYEHEVSDLDVGSHTFRLKQVTTDGSATYSEPVDVKIGLDGAFQLSTYPNPVQTQATVEFAVKEPSDITVSLYNTLGQKVRTVYRGTPTAEETKRVQIDTQDLSSGAYFLRLQGDGVTGTERVTVVK